MLLINVGVEEGLEGSEELNWFRMVLGEMESWKNWESEMVESAEARWLVKSDSAVFLEMSMACLDMSMDIWMAVLVVLLVVLLLVPLPMELRTEP